MITLQEPSQMSVSSIQLVFFLGGIPHDPGFLRCKFFFSKTENLPL